VVSRAWLLFVIDPRGITVIAATPIEARAVRRECPAVNVVESGIALVNIDPAQLGDTVVSCGLAGGLSPSYQTGSVLVPREVVRPDGTRLSCDRRLQDALVQSARRLGNVVIEDPMITSETFVRGTTRAELGTRGYAGVDMESGLLHASRIAVVRVILDTPSRELSDAWLDPATAFLNPRLWPEAFWLARNAPRCARTAARVVRFALAR
jgi:hypothetical protein